MDRTASCPSCSQRLFLEDAFCSACGTRVQARNPQTGASRRTLVTSTIPTGKRVACRSCNSPVLVEDVFCAVCGAPAHSPSVAGPMAKMWAGILRKLESANEGKLEFVRQLGHGGMGTVYLARDLALERLVAIKVLSPSWLTDEGMVTRFRREAKTIAKLRHQSIVTVYGVGQAENIHYFIMDYIEGASLAQLLRYHGPLSLPVIKSIVYQVGSALDYAHRPSRGVVHRDIKPSNIMLDTEGNAYVMDFGISKVTASQTGLTRTGVIMGTPEHMSPEQCRGAEVDKASDQYALGTVVYAMLTGAPPFTGPSYQVLMAHNTQEPPQLLDTRPDCSTELAEAVGRMLRKVPAERWPDIGKALRACGAQPLSGDHPVREEIAGLVRMVMSRRAPDRTPGGSTAPGHSHPDQKTPTWLEIMGPPPDIERGDRVTLTATVFGDDGSEETGQPIRWESTDPYIVQVDSSTGELVAVGVGSASVTARSGSATESVRVEVQPERVARVGLQPADCELSVGREIQLNASAVDKRGRTLDRPVFWSSSDPRIATVTDHGVVRAYAEGQADVLAHCEGVAAAASVRVTEGSPPPDDPSSDGGIAYTAAEREAANEAFWAAIGTGEQKTPHAPAGTGAGVVGQATELFGDEHGPGDFAGQRPPTGTLPDAEAPPSGEPPDTGASDRRKLFLIGGPVALIVLGAALWLGAGVLFDSGSSDGPAETTVATVEIRTPEDETVGSAGLVMEEGDAARLRAAASDPNGAAVDGAPVDWSSLDPSVATVDPRGLVVARGPGVTQIVAAVDRIVRRVNIQVVDPEATVAETDAGSADRPEQGAETVPTQAEPAPAPEQRTAEPEQRPPPPARGTLQVNIRPWAARVFVDGVLRGENARELVVPLAPGAHTLRLEREGYAPVDRTIQITSGEPTTVNIRMQPGGP